MRHPMFSKRIVLDITCEKMQQSIYLYESQFMGSQDVVSPKDDIRNQNLEDAVDADFDMENVYVEDDFLRGDVGGYLFETLTD